MMHIIRAARFPADKPSVLAFIDGLQCFEHALEPNRRTDDFVAEEYFADITARVEAWSSDIYRSE